MKFELVTFILSFTNIDNKMLQSGGKWYNVETGRRDGNVSLASNVNLPPPFISVSDSIKLFASKKLTPTDMVYLLGNFPFYNPSFNSACFFFFNCNDV